MNECMILLVGSFSGEEKFSCRVIGFAEYPKAFGLGVDGRVAAKGDSMRLFMPMLYLIYYPIKLPIT